MSERQIEQICPGERPGYRRDLKRAMRRRERREKRELINRSGRDDAQPEKPARRRFRGYSIAILLALAAPALAWDLPEPLPAVGGVPIPSDTVGDGNGQTDTEPDAEPLPGLYLAAWCSLSRGDDDAVATCDQGLAGALASWDPGERGGLRTSWVVFAGPETAGTGVAVSRRLSERVVLGLGAGVVVPIPEEGGGIEVDDARLAVGVTASFW